jgi:hypothetical protein
MEVEIIFMSSSTPKKITGVDAVYTKDALLCVQVGEMIMKYPLCNVFSVCHPHGPHWGTGRKYDTPGELKPINVGDWVCAVNDGEEIKGQVQSIKEARYAEVATHDGPVIISTAALRKVGENNVRW